MSKLQFTKMHGIGNDYIYVNCLSSIPENPSELARRLSHRHFGIGSDGLVLICRSEQADFRMRMFNSDGSESEMCGNAVRCIGKFVYEKGLSKATEIRLETGAGVKVLQLSVKDGIVDAVRVDMGEPILDAAAIPTSLNQAQIVNHPFEIEGHKLRMTCVSMGNPHAVFFVDKITDEMIFRLGPKIETNPFFPRKTNVEFVQVISPTELRMRVWERGAGETQACGTGAAAALVAAVLNEKSSRSVTIHLLGGDLQVEWGTDNHVYKTGPAELVFEGTVEI